MSSDEENPGMKAILILEVAGKPKEHLVETLDKMIDLMDKENGVSVILISHRLQDVFNVADRIMVLRSGETIADEKIENTSMDRIVKYIVGG